MSEQEEAVYGVSGEMPESAGFLPTGGDCEQCHHPADPHAVVATTGDPMEGGIILCPTKNCFCFATWAVGDGVPFVPEMPAIQEYRDFLQAGLGD